MKTAVSVPDEVFEAAEELALEMGVSRSGLYARALAEYLARHGRDDVRERLDTVYAHAKSGVDTRLEELQALSVSSEDW
ncbi:MAG: CopG family transcriptional regulator [Planctomycetota bacterium]